MVLSCKWLFSAYNTIERVISDSKNLHMIYCYSVSDIHVCLMHCTVVMAFYHYLGGYVIWFCIMLFCFSINFFPSKQVLFSYQKDPSCSTASDIQIKWAISIRPILRIQWPRVKLEPGASQFPTSRHRSRCSLKTQCEQLNGYYGFDEKDRVNNQMEIMLYFVSID
jgi:hypothetical protein